MLLPGGASRRSCSSAGPRISDLVIWFNWQIGAPGQAIPDRLRSLNCQDSPVNDLAAAAVRAGDDLQPVTVGAVEQQAAAAVAAVDPPAPALAGIRPVRQPPVPDAAEGGVELVLAHEERGVRDDHLSPRLS